MLTVSPDIRESMLIFYYFNSDQKECIKFQEAIKFVIDKLIYISENYLLAFSDLTINSVSLEENVDRNIRVYPFDFNAACQSDDILYNLRALSHAPNFISYN